MIPTTHAGVQRLLVGSRERFWLAEHGDAYPDQELWLTNQFLLVPARRCRGLFAYYNITQPAPGEWQVEPRGKHAWCKPLPDHLAAKIAALLDPGRYQVPLQPVELDGYPACVRPAADGPYLRALRRPDGRSVYVDADSLGFITHDDDPAAIDTPYGYRYTGAPLLRQHDDDSPVGDHEGPVGAFAEREHRTGGELAGPGRWVPARWDPDGQRLLGVVMPYRLKPRKANGKRAA